MKNQPLQTDQKKVQPNAARTNDNVPSAAKPSRSQLRGLPWVWIALSGLATAAWLAGIGWIVLKLFQWFAD
jgi:hypothetical protein